MKTARKQLFLCGVLVSLVSICPLAFVSICVMIQAAVDMKVQNLKRLGISICRFDICSADILDSLPLASTLTVKSPSLVTRNMTWYCNMVTNWHLVESQSDDRHWVVEN
jgi:hypothetical protein